MPPPACRGRTPAARPRRSSRRSRARSTAPPRPGPIPAGSRVHRLNRAEYHQRHPRPAGARRLPKELDIRRCCRPTNRRAGSTTSADVLCMSRRRCIERYLSAPRARSAASPSAIRRRPRMVDTYQMSGQLPQDDPMSTSLPFGTRGGTADSPQLSARWRVHVRDAGRLAERRLRSEHRRPRHVRDRARDRRRARQASFTAPEAPRPARARPAVGYGRTASRCRCSFPSKAGPHDDRRGVPRQSAPPDRGAGRAPTPRPSAARIRLPCRRASTISGPVQRDAVPATRRAAGGSSCAAPTRPPARPDGETACADADSRRRSRAARTAGRSTDADVEPLLRLLPSGRAEGGFEAGIQAGARSACSSAPSSCSASSAIRPNVAPGASYRISDLELASRLSFFFWSSIPDDELLDAGRRAGSSRVRRVLERAGAADARRSAVAGAGRATSPGSGCTCAIVAVSARRSTCSRFRRQPAAGHCGAKPSCSSTASARGSQRARPAERRLHVPQRAAGAALRHPERLRQPVPPRDAASRQPAPRAARSGQHPDRHVVREPHVAGVPRQVGARERSRHAAAAAAARRAGARRRTTTTGRRLRPCASGMEEHRDEPVVRGLPRADGSARVRAREFRRHRAVAHAQRSRTSRSTARRRFPTGRPSKASPGCATCSCSRRSNAEFARTVIAKMLSYALGRGSKLSDQPYIRAIMRDAAPDRYAFESLIAGIVNSVPFQQRRSRASTQRGPVEETVKRHVQRRGRRGRTSEFSARSACSASKRRRIFSQALKADTT